MAMTDPTDQVGPDGSERSAGPQNGDAKMQHASGGVYQSARQRTGAMYETARQRANDAIESSRESAARARQKAADGLDASPMAAVFGGLAIGAVVAALLPRTRQENATLGKLGGQITAGARGAAEAARDAGRDKLDELGLSPDGLRERLGKFSGTATDALRTTANAAVGGARKTRK